jgi:hypothetical protein
VRRRRGPQVTDSEEAAPQLQRQAGITGRPCSLTRSKPDVRVWWTACPIVPTPQCPRQGRKGPAVVKAAAAARGSRRRASAGPAGPARSRPTCCLTMDDAVTVIGPSMPQPPPASLTVLLLVRSR